MKFFIFWAVLLITAAVFAVQTANSNQTSKPSQNAGENQTQQNNQTQNQGQTGITNQNGNESQQGPYSQGGLESQKQLEGQKAKDGQNGSSNQTQKPSQTGQSDSGGALQSGSRAQSSGSLSAPQGSSRLISPGESLTLSADQSRILRLLSVDCNADEKTMAEIYIDDELFCTKEVSVKSTLVFEIERSVSEVRIVVGDNPVLITNVSTIYGDKIKNAEPE
ncbi:MAG: hypothetical protein PHW04_09455 [Candidatus Wallbacteria bacterium]|nr:hypothetical protein [Candidatus Wallbacteria bacterium]